MDRHLINSYRRQLTLSGAQGAAAVTEICTQYAAHMISRAELIESLILIEQLFGSAVVKLASGFVIDWRVACDMPAGMVVPASVNEAGAAGRGAWAVKQIDAIPMDAARGEVARRIGEQVGVATDRTLKMVGRETVMGSAIASGNRWRRVCNPHPCAFCALWVGRGTFKGRKTTEATKYHAHCGCVVVESPPEWTPTPDERKYEQAYLSASEQGDDLSGLLSRMRGLPLFSDSTKNS